MDHGSAFYMTTAILAALHHRDKTGEGQHVDLATVSAGIAMLPTEILDWTVNRRSTAARGNRADFGEMAPHGIYPCLGDDRWIAMACRDERELGLLAKVLNEPELASDRFSTLDQRLQAVDELDQMISAVTATRDAATLAEDLNSAGVPASVVKSPAERTDGDPDLAAMNLFPTVTHPDIGDVRVEGIPMRFSATPWEIASAAPRVGQHNREILKDLLGHSDAELDDWTRRGVI
jgi:crotonobetainyl-CoA:carnitine CoA-transferase CaiB-like acyl-CoA transferase